MRKRHRYDNRRSRFVTYFFLDVDGNPSSKRILTICSFIVLVITWAANLFFAKPIVPQFVFDAFTWIVIGGMGSVAAEKFSLAKDRQFYDEVDYGHNRRNWRSLDEEDINENQPIIGEEDPEEH